MVFSEDRRMLSVGFHIAGPASDEAAHRLISRAPKYEKVPLEFITMRATLRDMNTIREALENARPDSPLPEPEIDTIVSAAVQAASPNVAGIDLHDRYFGSLGRHNYGVHNAEVLARDFITDHALKANADAFANPLRKVLRLLKECKHDFLPEEAERIDRKLVEVREKRSAYLATAAVPKFFQEKVLSGN